MLLTELLNLPARPLISIVGAGGKTTTMYTLANELAAQGKRVITTTTTHIFLPRTGETDTLIVAPETAQLLKMIAVAWKEHRRITVAKGVIGAGKLAGLQPEQPYDLLLKSGTNAVLVEADGARHLKIKAPAEYEPVVPPQTNVALLLMSAEVINQPLSGEIAHRPEQIAKVADMHLGDILSPVHIARLMTSEQGAMKAIPETAVTYLLMTHVTHEKSAAIREVISLVRQSPRVTDVLCSPQPGDWFRGMGSQGS